MPEGLSALERDVLERIRADELESLTRELVAAPGENPPGGEGPTATVLSQACVARGLACESSEVAPGRPNVVARLPGGDSPGLLLLGHTDVVPAGEGWTVDPCGGTVVDGRLYGRGAADMLGGLAACVVAMSALRSCGVPLAGAVELAAVVDEEETGLGIRHYLAGEDRSGAVGCIVAEPTDLGVISAARGDAYLEIDVTGRAAHSGNPADGANAIYGAASVITELERWHHEMGRQEPHPLVGHPTWSVGQVSGGTGTSTVAAHCSVVADRRLLPGESGTEVLDAVRDRLERLALGDRGLGVSARMSMEMPGFETDTRHPLVLTADRSLADAGGPRLPIGGWSAACDGGFVARDTGVPVIVMGPGSVAEQAHRPDESVAICELAVAARAYALAAIRLLGPADAYRATQ